MEHPSRSVMVTVCTTRYARASSCPSCRCSIDRCRGVPPATEVEAEPLLVLHVASTTFTDAVSRRPRSLGTFLMPGIRYRP